MLFPYDIENCFVVCGDAKVLFFPDIDWALGSYVLTNLIKNIKSYQWGFFFTKKKEKKEKKQKSLFYNNFSLFFPNFKRGNSIRIWIR